MKELSRHEYFVGCVASGLISKGETSNFIVDVEAYVAMLEKHCDSKEGSSETTPSERKGKTEAATENR